MKSRRNELTTAGSGPISSGLPASSIMTSRPKNAPKSNRRSPAENCDVSEQVSDRSAHTSRSVAWVRRMCELWGRLSALSAHSSGDAGGGRQSPGSGASANHDVARRQATRRDATVNAVRIACVNAPVALKRFTVDTTSRSQRQVERIDNR